jgi:multicomponent Na+:H+ antiporter subunit D
MDAGLPALVVVVPLLSALLLGLVGRWWRGAAPVFLLGATGFACAGSIRLLWRAAQLPPGESLVYAMGAWPAPTGIVYVVDRLNGIVLTMVASVAFLVAVWMIRPVGREIREAARISYAVVMLLFVTGLLGITITGDVFNLYVFLEIASITAYVLVAMGRRRQALYAGFSYLVVGSIGATFILLGIGHLYMATGSLTMSDIAARLPAQYVAHPSVVLTAFGFLTAGLAMKMALFPLHGWQPAAYTFAPSTSSVLLAATATKVAAYAFYRFAFGVFGLDFLQLHFPALRDGVVVMAAAAIVVGPLMAVRQDDMKRLLAYSSVGQIGYIMLGVVLLNAEGLTGGILHFWNHAAAKAALFCAAGVLVYHTGRARVSDLAGLGRVAPFTGTALTVAGCSLVGVPLTAGFLSKLYLATGALAAGRWFLVPVLLFSSILTAVYVWRFVQLVWFTPPPEPRTIPDEVPWSMRLPALALAAACIVFGTTSLSVDLARRAAEAILG